MNDYDFHTLNDKEFESMCINLLSIEFGTRIERFKPGKDSGIDGRFFKTDGGAAIIQCKHWIKSGITALLAYLATTESLKLAHLRPDRYILTTSVPLSPTDKAKIVEIFRPYIRSPADIYGPAELNDLLSRHREVEERFYKLWLASTRVLSRLLNAPIKGRSNFVISEARDFSKRYVTTASHGNALAKLESLRTVIIMGAPGVGKTTLAEQLILQYLGKGYELGVIAASIDEAESIWEEGTKQIFYFDDFLGRNYLFALKANEDSQITRFIKRVNHDPLKRLIITSRTTILIQGKRLSDLFRLNNLDQNEYEIRVEHLTEIERAKILYNHIWHGSLPESYIDTIYHDKRYRNIIRHANFNPRLISFITDFNKTSAYTAENFWSYIESTLSNPSEIWDHLYSVQLSEESRLLVRLCVLNGSNIRETILAAAFERYRSNHSADAFYNALRLSVGSVLNRDLAQHSRDALISPFDPSLADYIIHRYSQNLGELSKICGSLATTSAIRNIYAQARADIIGSSNFSKILLVLCDSFDNPDIPFDFLVVVADICLTIDDKFGHWPKLRDYIVSVAKRHDEVGELATQCSLIVAGIDDGCLSHPQMEGILIEKIGSLVEHADNHDEFVWLSSATHKLPPESVEDLSAHLVQRYVDVLRETVNQDVIASGVLDSFTDPDYIDEAEDKVLAYYTKLSGELDLTVTRWDLKPLVDACDYHSIIERNFGNWDSDDEGYYGGGGGGQSQDVDDLFDRS